MLVAQAGPGKDQRRETRVGDMDGDPGRDSSVWPGRK